MNNRERFHRSLSFQPVDRVFNHELGLWGQTLDRWRQEGLPEDVHIGGIIEGCEYFGLDRMGYLLLHVMPMMPAFTEEVLAEDERYVIKRWDDGHISKALKEGTAHGWRASMDQYVSFPVTDRDSWEDVKRRYDAHSPARYPEWWEDTKRCLKERDYPLALTCNGAFGLYSFLRRLMGTEKACTIFYEDPILTEEILDYWTDYVIELLHPALEQIEADYFNYFEDFAYKTAPLIGPKIFRKFLLPRYRRVNDFLRAHGVHHIWLDSDGNTEVLIPLFIEAGITFHYPLERAAGMDPLKLRQTYGKTIALGGGVDKLPLARDKKAIDEEFFRHVPQLVEQGGYIPFLDHWVPPDVPYENFMYYLELKRKTLGI